MKKKIKLNVSFDAPVTITFAVLSLVLFLMSTYLIKDKAGGLLLASATNAGGSMPFAASNVTSYFRTFLYVFGGKEIASVIFNLIFILLLGPSLEEYYGSVLVAVCYFITAVFAGVLNACFCSTSLQGSSCIVMMMIFLSALMSVSKHKMPVSSVLVLALCIVNIVISEKAGGIAGIFINIVAGLCSSLPAFIVSPLIHPEQKKSKGLLDKAEKVRKEEFDEPKKKKKDSTTVIRKKSEIEEKPAASSDDDTTVVGTLKF